MGAVDLWRSFCRRFALAQRCCQRVIVLVSGRVRLIAERSED